MRPDPHEHPEGYIGRLTMVSHLVFGAPATALLIVLVMIAVRRTETRNQRPEQG